MLTYEYQAVTGKTALERMHYPSDYPLEWPNKTSSI